MTSLTFKSWSVSSILQHRSLISIMFNPFHVPGGKHCPPTSQVGWKLGPRASPCWTSVRTGQTSRRNLYMPFLSCSNWPPFWHEKSQRFQIHVAHKMNPDYWRCTVQTTKQQCSKFPKPAEAAASIPNMIRVQIGPHPDELATTRSNLSAYTLLTIT